MDRAWGLCVIAAGCTPFFPEDEELVDEDDIDLWGQGRVIPRYQISYIANGRGFFRSNEIGEVTLEAGDMFLILPGVWHAFHPDCQCGWHEYWVAFDGPDPDRLRDFQIISPWSPIYHLGSVPAVEQTFREIDETLKARPLIDNRIVAAKTQSILAHAISAAGVYAEAGAGRDPLFQRARVYLAEHLAEDVDMDVLARSLCTSYSVLRRQFHAATGLAPHKYHLLLRINRAKDLLLCPTNQVREVARQLGFEDLSYFSRVFRREAGCSPSEWRKAYGPHRTESHGG